MNRFLLIFILLLSFVFMSCGGNSTGPDSDGDSGTDTTMYDVDLTGNPSEGGTISPSGQNTYEEGEQIELQAQASEGYVFSGWTGDITSSDNPHSLTVDQDYSITANFEVKSYELTINTEGNGSVDEKIVEQQSKEYEHGTLVELKAVADKGYQFVEWTGDVTGTDNPVQIMVENPREVTAVFEKKSFGVNVTTSGSGSVALNPDQQEFLYNSTVELEANPDHGWSFVEWQGDVSGTDTLVTVTVDTAKTITAVFDSPFAGGTGTEADPFQISTIKQLQAINNVEYSSDYFIQINDIDASATAGGSGGIEFTPIMNFEGSYDGQEYTISNFTINSTSDYIGLFGWLNKGAQISNIRLVDVDITGGSSTGSLIGHNLGEINNSSATGTVHCLDERCGGLVATNRGSVENSFADVNVSSNSGLVGGLVGINRNEIITSFALGDVSGTTQVGGLAGSTDANGESGYSYRIFRSYAQGSVAGEDYVGGLIGIQFDGSYISSAYATGKVTFTSGSNTFIGGLVGRYNYSGGTFVEYCYWDKENSGQTEAVYGGDSNVTGLTTAQMTGSNAVTNMPDFDFVNIWQTIDAEYPALFWE
ncbi:InlB B-repeat-containing protein [Fodinibius sp. SL11]|uniref:InlB B-repeat-containing protein n=1 Tax=Fodinibius sp. SL11 TaxID=3425690 RepID=UPI003F88346B